MATGLKALTKYIDAFGPSSVIAHGKFTTANTAAPTINESQGIASITRAGVGIFDVVFLRGWKAINVTTGLQGTTAAQSVLITSENTSTRTVRLTVVGAGGNTAADTTGLIINSQAIQRIAI